MQESVQCSHVTVRAVVFGSVTYYLACLEHTRELFPGYADGRVCLVVLEEDVVSGLVSFNQVVFQKERVPFRFHHNIFQVRYLAYEHTRLVGLALLNEIRGDPSLQVFGLSNVYYGPLLVQILVAAGLFRQVLDNQFQPFFVCLLSLHPPGRVPVRLFAVVELVYLDKAVHLAILREQAS